MAREKQVFCTEDYYDSLNKKFNEEEAALGEMTSDVLTKRAEYQRIQLEVSQLYNPKYYEKFRVVEGHEEDAALIREKLKKIQELCNMPSLTSPEDK